MLAIFLLIIFPTGGVYTPYSPCVSTPLVPLTLCLNYADFTAAGYQKMEHKHRPTMDIAKRRFKCIALSTCTRCIYVKERQVNSCDTRNTTLSLYTAHIHRAYLLIILAHLPASRWRFNNYIRITRIGGVTGNQSQRQIQTRACRRSLSYLAGEMTRNVCYYQVRQNKLAP